jgi:cytoplasmic polyadenylation element-binding protein
VITTYCTDLDVNLQDTDEENQNSSETISSIEWSFCNMLTPSEGHGPWSIRSLLDQRLVKLSARATVNRGPALLAIILETSHVRTEERSKLSATSPSLTLVTELIIQHVRLYLDPLVNLAVLQLDKPGRDGRFGPLVVDWPHKAESKSYFPPKGYAFLLFQDESSVQALIEQCIQDEDKLYLCVSSPTIKDKPVQIRPWKLSDADFVLDATLPLDPRKTVFVGGVPRPLKAVELAMIMDRLYGGVCYAGIDTDPELRYPKGAGRVAFSNQQSYIAAISARFVQLQHGEIDKRVEVKPYVLDDQLCDECQGGRCGGKFAPFFCANVTCLQYYCEQCWSSIHSRPGREFHKPLVKEGADRPRAVPFRWC